MSSSSSPFTLASSLATFILRTSGESNSELGCFLETELENRKSSPKE